MSHGSDRSASEGRTEKRIGLAVAVALMAVVLFSALFRLFEADHDCAGDDCPICACLHQCDDLLRLFGAALPPLAAAAAVYFIPYRSRRDAFFLICPTPVSKKTRLNR